MITIIIYTRNNLISDKFNLIGEGRMQGRNVMKIVLPVLASVLVLILCMSLVIWICKSKGIANFAQSEILIQFLHYPHEIRNVRDILEAGKRQKRDNLNRLVLGDLDTHEGLGAGNPAESFEFPMVSFKRIVGVTNHFQKSYMIGHGGFGKVYKVLVIYM